MAEKNFIRGIPATVRRWFDSPIHRLDTGLHPGRSRWRSRWCWLVGLIAAMYGALMLAVAFYFSFPPHSGFGPGPVENFSVFVSLAVTGFSLMALYFSARSWDRDRSPESRDQISVLPLTSQEIIAAKTKVWFTPVLIAHLLSVGCILIGGLVELFRHQMMGGWAWPFSSFGSAIDDAPLVASTLMLAGMMITQKLCFCLIWLLAFALVAHFSLKHSLSPLFAVVATLAILFAGSIGAAIIFVIVIAITGALLVDTAIPLGFLLSMTVSLVVLSMLLALLCKVFFFDLPSLVLKRYNLSK